MKIQKYSVNQHLIETVFAWVKSGEIAIPEIQRPFVWDATKVRDLLDSLYQGYPVGYIISWKNPDVRLKDGSRSEGKRILIDGQQRVTALRASILGEYVVNKNYKRVRIIIAFNPAEGRFEVQTPIIVKNRLWIADISTLFQPGANSFTAISDYLQRNPEADRDAVIEAINSLFELPKKQVGHIELGSDLDIETVTEIFIRINSQGVVLSQADFAMSKIAANDLYGGQDLRKAIDYFCHLAVAPEFFHHIKENDPDFANTEFFQKMAWLRQETDDLFDPTYTDMLRVSFGTEFHRAKLSDLVSLLSGRNFEERTFEAAIAEKSFGALREGVLKFMNQTNFTRFVMIIKSAGFVVPSLIKSRNALNFAYILYLMLRDRGEGAGKIERYVKKWFALGILTGRSSGSFESQFDYDIKQIANRDFGEYLAVTEAAELSDAFWNLALPQGLDTSTYNSPYFQVFLAAQIAGGDKGFLSKDISVRELVEHRGDIHHVFPAALLKRRGVLQNQYNQIANYAYIQQEINIRIGDRIPHDYFAELLSQCNGGSARYGNLDREDLLHENLRAHCIPTSIFDATAEDYSTFLAERRKLMAQKIRAWYEGL